MVDVNHAELGKFLDLYREKRKSLFISGATGIGKSEVVSENSKAYAVKKGLVWVDWKTLTYEDKRNLLNPDEVKKFHLFVDIRTALLEPTDLMGLPSTGEDGFVRWKPTLLFKVLSSDEVSATVFLDEFNLGSRMVQNAAYMIVLDKAIGEVSFGKDVFVVAAGNRVEDKANIIETPAPLNNRFGHVTLQVPTVDDWISYNMSSSASCPRLAGFLKFKPEMIHNFKPNMKEKSFSSPRALQTVAVLTQDLNEVKDLGFIRDISSSVCGEVFASNYEAFVKLSRNVDIDEILANPEKVQQYNKGELDLKYSIISSVAHKVKQSFSKNMDPALMVCYYLEPEFGIFAMRMMRDLVGSKKFTDYVRKSDIWTSKLSVKFAGLLSWD